MGSLRKRGGVWWIRYNRGGKRYEESAHSEKKQAAIDLLKIREGDVARGLPVTAKIGQLRFEEAAADVVNDYTVNGKRSVDGLQRRLDKHLAPFFGGRRLATISTADVRAYIAARQAATTVTRRAFTTTTRAGREIRVPEWTHESTGASNAEINRELAALKRVFNLAVQAGKILHKPYIPLLKESNTRTGFFERGQYESVRDHLPAPLRPVVSFAYLTGWRIRSEVLPLEWRQVDFDAGEVRLDPGTTKNGEGRTFPMNRDLRALLERQRDERDRLKTAGTICRHVFHRDGARIESFAAAWREACRLAGCPGKIPHDFRRTAVRNLVRAGVSEKVAMQLTGHKTRSVFDRYDIVANTDLRDAVAKLQAASGTKMGQSVDSTRAAS